MRALVSIRRFNKFRNREDAGKKLAEKLGKYKGKENVLVLAIPKGGVPVAFSIAKALKLPLDVFISRKLPLPENPEAGFGAITYDGLCVLDKKLARRLDMKNEEIESIKKEVYKEVERRALIYRDARPYPNVENKTIILVDDGLAAGWTMAAAVKSIKSRKPRKVVVAVPCASETAARLIKRLADEFICLSVGGVPFAVADYYENWYELTDDEVLEYLKPARAKA